MPTQTNLQLIADTLANRDALYPAGGPHGGVDGGTLYFATDARQFFELVIGPGVARAWVQVLPGAIASGPLASRPPAAGAVGTFFLATDQAPGADLSFSDGTGWQTIAEAGVTPLSGDVTGSTAASVVRHFTLDAASDAGGHAIANVAAPAAGGDAANRTYADAGDAASVASAEAYTDARALRVDGTNAPTADVGWGGHRLTGLAAPAAGGDATNKTYADAGDAASVATAEAFATAAVGGVTPASIGAVPASGTTTWDLANGGVAIDYTLDAGYALAGWTASPAGGVRVSRAMGDGVHVPKFYAGNDGLYQTLALTTAPALRVGCTNAVNNVELFPLNLSTTGSVWLIVPLPDFDQGTVDVVLSANVGVATTDNITMRGQVSLGGWTGQNNTLYQDAYAGCVWNTTTHAINELWNGPQNPSGRTGETVQAPNAGFVSGTVYTRRFRFVIDGPTVRVLGAPDGGSPTATPTQSLAQYDNTQFFAERRRRFLVLASTSQTGTAATRGLYAEVQPVAAASPQVAMTAVNVNPL